MLLALTESIPVYCVITVVLVSGPYPFLLVPLALLLPRLLTALFFEGPTTKRRRYGFYLAIGITGLATFRAAAYPDLPPFDLSWLPGALKGLALVESGERRTLWASALLVGYAWWRALQPNELSITTTYRLLRLGTLALVAVTLVASLLGNRAALDEGELAMAALCFFGGVLLTIGAVRRAAQPRLGVREGFAAWLASVAAPVLLVLLLSLTAVGLLSGRARETLGIPIEPGLELLGLIAEGLVLFISLLVILVVRPIAWLIAWLLDLLAADGLPPAAEPDPAPTPAPRSDGTLTSLPDPLGYLFAAVVVLVGIWLLARLINRTRPRSPASLGEERSSVFSWHAQLDAFGSRFQRAATPAPDPLTHLRGRPEWAATLRIRESYLAFQRWGREKGRRRTRGETAGQYGGVIHRGLASYPTAQHSVDALTERYREARYSGVPATPQEAELAEQAVAAIERAGGPTDA